MIRRESQDDDTLTHKDNLTFLLNKAKERAKGRLKRNKEMAPLTLALKEIGSRA